MAYELHLVRYLPAIACGLLLVRVGAGRVVYCTGSWCEREEHKHFLF